MQGSSSHDPNLRRSSHQSSPSYLGASIRNFRSPHLAQRDEDILARAVQDAGLHAFGCVFVEVWVVSSDGRHMTRPSGGHWMDPVFVQTHPEPERAEGVRGTAPDCAPGESLAGTLFNQTNLSTFLGNNLARREVHWRQIRSMVDDPFIQHSRDKRMEQLHDLGIGIVATVPFSFQGRDGIVLFMSRPDVSVANLTSEHNKNYLIGATDLIGAAFAVRIPRMECSRIRRETFANAIEKVRKNIRQEAAGKPSFASVVRRAYETERRGKKPMAPCAVSEEETEQAGECIPEQWTEAHGAATYQKLAMDQVKRWISKRMIGLKNSVRKWKGAGLRAAPRQSFGECLIIFCGIFCVMLALVNYAVVFQNAGSVRWTVDPGWYASSLCILFAMTAAPSGQPTQIVCAHLWCALVGYAFQQIPTNNLTSFAEFINTLPEERQGSLPVYWKQAMSVATGVSGMAYFGFIHPPASGLAFTFATNGAWDLNNILVLLLGDLIMVIFSMVILNAFQSKQYPMFWFGYDWTFSGWRKCESGLCNKRSKKRQGQTDREDDDVAKSSHVEPIVECEDV